MLSERASRSCREVNLTPGRDKSARPDAFCSTNDARYLPSRCELRDYATETYSTLTTRMTGTIMYFVLLFPFPLLLLLPLPV
jgi:hypothetical protein